MEIEVSNKIRLALNELAILNQPDVKNEKFIYHVDTLQRLKQLCSELYLLSDLELNQSASQDASESVLPEKIELIIPAITIEHPPELVLPSTEILAPVIPPVINVPPPLEPITVPEITEPQIEPVKELPKSNKVENLSTKISITRRFEYINNLFAGNADSFLSFLSEIENANNLDSAITIFDREYEQRNWKKKAESAADLKSMIKKWF